MTRTPRELTRGFTARRTHGQEQLAPGVPGTERPVDILGNFTPFKTEDGKHIKILRHHLQHRTFQAYGSQLVRS